MTDSKDPDGIIGYVIRWRRRRKDEVAAAARLRSISVADWLNLAIEGQLERDREQIARYRIRPGRYALVAPSLDDLKGPAEGVVELPLHLFWSRPDRRFALADDGQLLEMYETVLLEVGVMDELTSLLNKEHLIRIWPQVYSKPVRRAWEDRHPVLREAAAKAAA